MRQAALLGCCRCWTLLLLLEVGQLGEAAAPVHWHLTAVPPPPPRRHDGLVAKLFGGKKKESSSNKPWLQW